MKIKKFGLIGRNLSHSFSKNYFNNKFKKEGLIHCQYDNYPLENIDLKSLSDSDLAYVRRYTLRMYHLYEATTKAIENNWNQSNSNIDNALSAAFESGAQTARSELESLITQSNRRPLTGKMKALFSVAKYCCFASDYHYILQSF